ncbi:MAG: hypothetical protein JJD97_01955 [Gemmatimonadaceae bacterium]|nr:hypothetical protein [Gemmatimonadaceae bacterium]
MNELYIARESSAEAPRLVRAVPFVAIGTACIVGGGLIAAVTARNPTEHESWAVAFLVLVGGVAQIALGLGQALLATSVPAARVIVMELAAYNAGSALVLVGTVVGKVLLTDVGGAILAIALVLLFRGVRGEGGRGGWPVNLYRLLIAIVLVSIPVGLVLAHIRAA